VKRDQFLGRVASALRGAALPEVNGPGRAPVISFPDPVEHFVGEATAVDADVLLVTGSAGVLDAVAGVFEARQATLYLAWEELDEVVPGWDAWCAQSGYQQVDTAVGHDPAARKDDHARVGAVPVGITTCHLGIAASGSVVLRHGPGRPRSASLLVESHIVLLPVSRIVSSFAEAMEQTQWEGTSNIAVITGPSRTADIESQLTLGVHGPRYLHIILIG